MKRTLRLWPIGLVLLGTMVIVEAQQPVRVTNTPLSATQSGTWTVQPGNTANTTPWLFQIRDAAGNARGANVDASNRLLTLTDINSSALPTGAATSALQTTGNTSVGSIDTKLMAAAALGDATSNPTTTGLASFNMCWNGATWDRCKAATANAGAADASTARVVNDPFWGGSLVKGTTASMTGTTSTSVISAVASNYIYVQQCVVTQSSTTVGTAINLQDGSGGTTLYTIPAPAAANSVVVTGAVIVFPAPIKVTTIGNALFAADVTTGSAVILSCSGFASTVSR